MSYSLASPDVWSTFLKLVRKCRITKKKERKKNAGSHALLQVPSGFPIPVIWVQINLRSMVLVSPFLPDISFYPSKPSSAINSSGTGKTFSSNPHPVKWIISSLSYFHNIILLCVFSTTLWLPWVKNCITFISMSFVGNQPTTDMWWIRWLYMREIFLSPHWSKCRTWSSRRLKLCCKWQSWDLSSGLLISIPMLSLYVIQPF